MSFPMLVVVVVVMSSMTIADFANKDGKKMKSSFWLIQVSDDYGRPCTQSQ